MLTLLLMRHAKAAPGEDDHARDLTSRGRRDAEAAGRWLASAGHRPDVVLCSDSRRTRRTTELVLAGLAADASAAAAPPPVQALAELYGAGPHRVLDVVTRTPDDAGTVLVVGHEPTTSALVAALTGRHVPFPTATVAVVRPQVGAWTDLAGGDATLETLHVPGD
ncbi:SixA phosphatase family protein [Thalassiella azotivora]